MPIGLFGTKIGMTQIFLKDGLRIPVTILKIKENLIIAKKTMEKDQYSAIQIGYEDIKKKLINKPELGHLNANGIIKLKKRLNEQKISTSLLDKFKIGETIKLNTLKDVRFINASGISKGKGFAGVMKRYNFKGFCATHGTHESFRGGGSIGMCTKPGRVFKGKKMPGRLGNKMTTSKNLEIIKIYEKENIICIKGSIPGGKNNTIFIQPSEFKKAN